MEDLLGRGQQVAHKARRLVNKDTHRLEESIGAEIIADRHGKAVFVGSGWGTGDFVDYAGIQELHPTRGKPHLRPALSEARKRPVGIPKSHLVTGGVSRQSNPVF